MESKKRNSLKPFQHTKKIIFLAFLLSILFHTGSVIYVAIKKSNQQSMPPLDDENNELQQKMKPHDEWAETKARAGNFGAPVMFVDDPDASLTEAVEDELEDELEKTSLNPLLSLAQRPP